MNVLLASLSVKVHVYCHKVTPKTIELEHISDSFIAPAFNTYKCNTCQINGYFYKCSMFHQSMNQIGHFKVGICP